MQTVFDSDVLNGVSFPEFLILITVTHQREDDVLNQNLSNTNNISCVRHTQQAYQSTVICTLRPQDVQQLWRQVLCSRRTTGLERSAAQSQTTWAVVRPVQAVTEDIFIQTVRPHRSVNCF